MNIGAFPITPTVATHWGGQPSPPSHHITATDLTRLLTRLDQKLGFSAIKEDSATQTQLTSLERAKIAANLEYARNLVTTLKKETETIRNLYLRQKTFAELDEQEQVIRRLNEKLHMSAHDTEDKDEDEDEEEKAARKETQALNNDDDESDDEDDGASSTSSSDGIVVRTNTRTLDPPAYFPGEDIERSESPFIESFGMRNRFPTLQEERSALFNNRGSREELPELTEKQLDAQRIEQEAITGEMLMLAQQLKQNSVKFGEELRKEKGLLDMAAEGLDRNMTGMERTKKKMKQLSRDESVGWLWGMLYPMIIVALAFFTLFIMLLAPKLRWW